MSRILTSFLRHPVDGEFIVDVPEHTIANLVPSDYLSLILKGAISDDCFIAVLQER